MTVVAWAVLLVQGGLLLFFGWELVRRGGAMEGAEWGIFGTGAGAFTLGAILAALHLLGA